MRIKLDGIVLTLFVCLPLASCAEPGQEKAAAMRDLEETAAAAGAPRSWEEARTRAREAVEDMEPKNYFTNPEQIALAEAATRGDLGRMRQAVADGANVNQVGRYSMTPLFWALVKQNFEAFQFLLEQGADPNLTTEDPGDSGYDSPLELAAALPDSRYLEAALQHGGDPNATINKWEQPVIRQAIMHRNLENVELLLEHGAHIDHQDKALKTPLIEATSARLYEIALFLLRKGADPTIKDKWGRSATDIVAQFGDRGIDRRTNDLAAYDEFVAELKERGLLDEEPPRTR